MSWGRLTPVEMLVVTYSNRSEAFYGFSDRYSFDIIIDSCYGSDDLVGKWIVARVDQRKRARDKVDIIEDKFPTRICYGQVEVKVRIRFDGHINQDTVMFHHNYFGNIGDLKRILYDVRNGDEYYVWIIRHKEDRLNCRWQVSHEQDSIQSCEQTSCEVNNTSSFEKVEGIITGRSRMNGFYLVWSDARPNSTICLDPSFCPPLSSMAIIGKWAEMEVDYTHRVRNPICFIRERYDTRVIAESPEMLVVFQHIKRYQQDFEMFHTEYFGMIYDPHRMVDNVENGGWYKGWIEHFQHRESKACWRLSSRQEVQGPFRTRPEYHPSFHSNIDRRHRSPSPNFDNDGYPASCGYSRYSSPESTRNRNREPIEREAPHEIRESDYVYVPSGIPFVEEQDLHQSTSNNNGKYQHSKQYETEGINCPEEKKGICDNVVPSNRIKPSNTEIVVSGDCRLDSEDPAKKLEHQSNQETLSIGDETIPSNNTSDSIASNRMLSKEIKQVEKKLSRISNLVKTFTDDAAVSISMKLWSLEEYEELMNLVDSYKSLK